MNINLVSNKNVTVGLRSIVDTIDAYVYIKDAAGYYIYVNQSVQDLFATTYENIIGKDDSHFFELKDIEDFIVNDRFVIENGESIEREEVTRIRSTGEQRTYRSIKKPLYNDIGQIVGLYGISTDITKYKQAEKDLQIAAIAFDSQEGIFITDDKGVILKVNPAFTKITGYSADEIIGMPSHVLKSSQHDASFYKNMFECIQLKGFWRGEIWNNYKSGEVHPDYMTISSVIDNKGRLTNYVATLTDITEFKLDEQVRLAAEVSLRNTLVREVHHRIKNNLQGVSGILRNFSAQYPESLVPVKKAISQVQTIAVIHGLQGRSSITKVRLCELTKEIAANNNAIWHTQLSVDIPSVWLPCLIAETEAVPIALVLNELITNAIKHSDPAKKITITIRHEPKPEMIQLVITNHGHISPNLNLSYSSGSSTGLQLITSLLPKKGAYLSWEQDGDEVVFKLKLESPVITLEQMGIDIS